MAYNFKEIEKNGKINGMKKRHLKQMLGIF